MENKEKSLVTTKQNAIQALAGRLQVDEKELQKALKSTVLKTAGREPTDSEFMMLAIVANTYGLNPILKELYVFPSKSGGLIPIVPIDGWVSLVNRNKDFDGVELLENKSDDGKLVSITSKFYLKSKSHPVVVTEYLAECKKSTDTWTQWPARMLRHKAYSQGARIAFGFSGIYDEDEAQRIIDGEATEITKTREMPKMIGDKPEPTPETSKLPNKTETPSKESGTPPPPEQPEPNKTEYMQVSEAIKIIENGTVFDMEGTFKNFKERKAGKNKDKTIYDVSIYDLSDETEITVSAWSKPELTAGDHIVVKDVKVYNPSNKAYYSCAEIIKK
ncbi:MAG: recombinase RecT [Bacteroidales bacterium]|nr:recombinase RecT [Bacteroidales bacterium]